MATPYQMQQMDKLAALEALTKGIVGQYGGGNDVKSVAAQNEAYVQGARQQGLTDAEIAAQVPKLPWNDSTRYIPSQSLMADELGPAPANAVSGGPAAPAPMPPAPVQAAMPAPAPAQAPAQKPTFLQRLGQGFDQAATAGLIDPSTLTKEQRRILRGQLLMNLGGALSQNRPVGEGFQQQYNMINTRQADQAAKAKAALTAQQEATRRQIYQNADWSTSEGAQKLVNDLSRAGLYDDAMEVTKNIVSKLSDDYTVMSDPRYGTILVDKTGRRPPQQINIPGATPINEIKPYEAATLALKERELGIKEEKAAAAGKAYRPLTASTATGLEKIATQRFQVDSSASTFKDDYAGYKGAGGPAMALGRILPGEGGLQDAADWWQGYDRYKNIVRNELFGASLTENEQAAFKSADITPNMSAETIRKNLARQRAVLDGAAARNGLRLISDGYNPETVSVSLGIDFTGYENPGYPAAQWNDWSVEERQQKQLEYWKAKTKPKQPGQPPAPAKPKAPNANDDALINKYLR